MENLKPVDNQRLLNALESLSVSIGFVSTAVEMVRDALLASPPDAAPGDSTARGAARHSAARHSATGQRQQTPDSNAG